ncbi:hypothetical protein IE53DRAFT_366563 [Violaceomyces palustris]|uniref:Uncharacterized protein n=1 Tax=Violaceomyces palustris TaxID=1673888 RepID=A0ACD0P518_9BASI|nr:hypothetical protein IE53DRAFT_366563 [Violaceomyces palustris]
MQATSALAGTLPNPSRQATSADARFPTSRNMIPSKSPAGVPPSVVENRNHAGSSQSPSQRSRSRPRPIMTPSQDSSARMRSTTLGGSSFPPAQPARPPRRSVSNHDLRSAPANYQSLPIHTPLPSMDPGISYNASGANGRGKTLPRLPQSAPSPPQGSELFDAIVQAADPKHPDHAAWLNRYGSISNRNPRGSVSSSTKKEKIPAVASDKRTGTASKRRGSMETVYHTKESDLADMPASSSSAMISRRALPAHDQADASSSQVSDLEVSFHAAIDDRSDGGDPELGVAGNQPALSDPRSSFAETRLSQNAIERKGSSGSSKHRRKKRFKEKGKGKATLPPLPPPRVSSSTNWQSTFGSPNGSVHTSAASDHASRSRSGSLAEHHQIGLAFSTEEEGKDQRIDDSLETLAWPTSPSYSFSYSKAEQAPYSYTQSVASPRDASNTRSPSSEHYSSNRFHRSFAPNEDEGRSAITMDHPYSSAFPGSPTNSSRFETTMATLPSPSVGETYTRKKSVSKIRRILGDDAPISPKASGALESSNQASAIPSEIQSPSGSGRKSLDTSRIFDFKIFPSRQDDEFNADEDFDSPSDPKSFDPSYTSKSSVERAPGVVRRSLDSVMSPFRMTLSKGKGAKGEPTPEALRFGRKSIDGLRSPSLSDLRGVSRFGLSRPRPSVQGGRPLSKVLDRPESANEEFFDAQSHVDSSEAFDAGLAPPAARVGPSEGNGGPLTHRSTCGSDFIHDHPSRHQENAEETFRSDGVRIMTAAPTPRATELLERVGGNGLLPAVEFGIFKDYSKRNVKDHLKTISGAPESSKWPEEFDLRRNGGEKKVSIVPDKEAVTAARASQWGKRKQSDALQASVPLQPNSAQDYTGPTAEEKKSFLAKNTYYIPSSQSWAKSSSSSHGAYYSNYTSEAHEGYLPSLQSSRSMNSNPNHSDGHAAMGMQTPGGDSMERFAERTTPSNLTGKFSGFLNKVKGTLTPGRTPPSENSSFYAGSPAASQMITPSQSASILPSDEGGRPSMSPLDVVQARVGLGLGKEILTEQRGEQQKRWKARAKSLIGSKRKNTSSLVDSPTLANVIHANQDDVWRRHLLSELVGQSIGSQSAQVGSESLENRGQAAPAYNLSRSSIDLLSSSIAQTPKKERRIPRKEVPLAFKKKPEEEDVNAIIQSLSLMPPRPDDDDEGKPRPSISSTRGFTITRPSMDELRSPGQQPIETIKKTLSPSLLRDDVNEEEELMSVTGSHDGGEHSEVNGLKLQQANGKKAPPFGSYLDQKAETQHGKDSRGAVLSDAGRKSLSEPNTPALSFAEHRVRRSVSGNLRPSPPPALQFKGRKSYDVPRSTSVMRDGIDSRFLDSPRHSPSYDPSTAVTNTPSKSPSRPSFSDALTPNWGRPSFSTPRFGRSSFSADRDRSPVGNSLSHGKNNQHRSPGLKKALKSLKPSGLGSSSSGKDLSKGIGPADVLHLEDDVQHGEEDLTSVSNPSSSRPLDPVQNMEANGRGQEPVAAYDSFHAAQAATEMLEAQAQAMPTTTSPFASSFASLNVSASALGSSNSTPALGQSPFGSSSTFNQARDSGSRTDLTNARGEDPTEELAAVGLGLSSFEVGSREGTMGAPHSNHSANAADLASISASNSSSTSISVSVSSSQQRLGAPSPKFLSTVNPGGNVYTPKTPELVAFGDMLGKFGQREKELLKDITARAVSNTPTIG